MIAALIAGAVLMLVAGFALGWAWDKREGALSAVSVLSVLSAIGGIAASAAVLIAWEQLSHARNEDIKQKNNYQGVYIAAIQRDLIWLVGRAREFQSSITIKGERHARKTVHERGFLDEVNYEVPVLETPMVLSLLPTFTNLPGSFAKEIGSLLVQVASYNQRLEAERGRGARYDLENIRALLRLSYQIEGIAVKYIQGEPSLPTPNNETEVLAVFSRFSKELLTLGGR